MKHVCRPIRTQFTDKGGTEKLRTSITCVCTQTKAGVCVSDTEVTSFYSFCDLRIDPQEETSTVSSKSANVWDACLDYEKVF